MKYLRHIGLVSGLVICGVLGGLMAPLPSEADNNIPPTVTIDGVSVTLTRMANSGSPSVCTADPSFNSCWSIDGTNTTTDATRNNTVLFGRYRVGDYGANNGARILINDTAASVDNIKMTGITFWMPGGGTVEGVVTITHTFNEGGGNPRGDYRWGMASGGQFDPPSNENVVGDRLRSTASGVFNSTVTLGSIDTCPLCSPPRGTPTTPTPTVGFTSPTTNNLVGYVTSSAASAIKVTDCHMPASNATGRCFPTVTLTYTIRTVGFDQLQLSDSVSGCGSSCFTPSLCEDPNGEEDVHLIDCPVQGDLPLCTDEDLQCPPIIAASVGAIVGTGIASGGSEACSGDCIVTIVKATPAKKGAGKTFNFTETGSGGGPPSTPFSITVLANGLGYHTSDVTPNVERVFNIPSYPAGFQTDQISCVSQLNNGTTTYTVEGGSVKGPLHVFPGANDTITCTWHVHTGK